MSVAKSMQLELDEVRQKVQFLKELNKSTTVKHVTTSNILNSDGCGENNFINKEINRSINEMESNNLINKQEIYVATNCFRKSLKLIENQYLQKNKKKKYKIKPHACNEINYTECFSSSNLKHDPARNKLATKYSDKISIFTSETKLKSARNNQNIDGSGENSSNDDVYIKVVYPQKPSKFNSNKQLRRIKNYQYSESNVENSTKDDVVFLKIEPPRKKQSLKSNDKNQVKIKKSVRKSCSYTKKEHNVSASQLNVENTVNKSSNLFSINNPNKIDYTRKFRKKDKTVIMDSSDTEDVIYIETKNISLQLNNSQNNYNVEENSLNHMKNKALFGSSNNYPNMSAFNAKTQIVDSPLHFKEISNISELHKCKKTSKICDLEISPVCENDLSENLPDWDFTVEPVDFSIPLLHGNGCVSELSEDEVKNFKSKGIEIKTGRWSENEEAVLKRNFDDFIEQFKISDARLLLGFGRRIRCDKAENLNAHKFLKAKQFYVRLGKDLNNRSLYSIYYKARRMFDPLKYIKKRGAKDLPYLLRLHKQYGNKWCLIAEKFGRSAFFCEYLYTKNKKKYVKGEWAEDETRRLINAIQNETSGFRFQKEIETVDFRFQKFKPISWHKISTFVGTRSAQQCFKKWSLDQKLSQEINLISRKWGKDCTSEFIFLLSNKYYTDDETNIDWQAILKHFSHVAPSITFLKKQWSYLKSHVPREYHTQEKFPDLIAFLYKKYCKSYKEL